MIKVFLAATITWLVLFINVTRIHRNPHLVENTCTRVSTPRLGTSFGIVSFQPAKGIVFELFECQ